MLKADVLAHFEDSPIKVARAANVTRSAVNQWKRVVPLDKALRLQAATDGALRVDPSLYEGLPAKTFFQIGRSGRRHAAA
jgi:hypothetical protein